MDVDGEEKERHQRITLMVAWWGRELQLQPGAPGRGPARVFWHPGALLPMASGKKAASGEKLDRQWSSVQAIAPAWVSIGRGCWSASSRRPRKHTAAAMPAFCSAVGRGHQSRVHAKQYGLTPPPSAECPGPGALIGLLV